MRHVLMVEIMMMLLLCSEACFDGGDHDDVVVV